MILISRTAVSTRKQCEMKRYISTHLKLTPEQKTGGVVPVAQSIPLTRGALFHELAEMDIRGEDWVKHLEDNLHVFPEDLRPQYRVLLRRALVGWKEVRGPVWKDYDLMSAEQEWQWALSPDVTQTLRLDKIFRRKEDGLLGIMDFKMMSSVDANWIERQKNSDQTHLYVQALKERSGEFVLGICYEGIYVGKLKDGWINSPLVTGYLTKSGRLNAKWTAGSTKTLLTYMTDEDWLEWMQEQGALFDMFPTSGFLNPTPEQLIQTKLATAEAELGWHRTLELVELQPERKIELIERNSDVCLKYGWEYACPYYDHCWKGFEFDEKFAARVDHHGGENE